MRNLLAANSLANLPWGRGALAAIAMWILLLVRECLKGE